MAYCALYYELKYLEDPHALAAFCCKQKFNTKAVLQCPEIYQHPSKFLKMNIFCACRLHFKYFFHTLLEN